MSIAIVWFIADAVANEAENDGSEMFLGKLLLC